MTLIGQQRPLARTGSLSPSAPPTSPGTNLVLVASAIAVTVWSVAYLVPHLYWAIGGTHGLSAVKPSARALPEWRAINWAASGVLALPAMLAVALVRARSRALKAGLLLVCLAGSSIAAAHGLYGIVYRALIVSGTIDVDGEPFDASRHGWVIWDLAVFEPWFLIEGLLLAALGAAVTPTCFRRRWIIACAAGIGFATLTGLLGLRV